MHIVSIPETEQSLSCDSRKNGVPLGLGFLGDVTLCAPPYFLTLSLAASDRISHYSIKSNLIWTLVVVTNTTLIREKHTPSGGMIP